MLQQLLPASIGDFLGVDFQVWGPNVSWRSALKEEQKTQRGPPKSPAEHLVNRVTQGSKCRVQPLSGRCQYCITLGTEPSQRCFLYISLSTAQVGRSRQLVP
jgi:hypothetical protein